MKSTPRLRMFAGPNGSGKSTIKKALPSELIGIYVNPDELVREVREKGRLDLVCRGLKPDIDRARRFFARAFLERDPVAKEDADKISLIGGEVDLSEVASNVYLPSVVSDFLRHELLAAKASFTFETVMSHPDKVEFLKTAREAGYRTYLYYVATEDPDINVSRVKNRVLLGGHDVPEAKIRSRYYRSLEQLYPAMAVSSRAYIFDNSAGAGEHFLIAKLDDNQLLHLEVEEVPSWFYKYVMEKIPT